MKTTSLTDTGKYPPHRLRAPWTFSLYRRNHHSRRRGGRCYFASVAFPVASVLLLAFPELICLSYTLHWRLSTQWEHRIRRGDTQPSTHQYLWCRTPCNIKKKIIVAEIKEGGPGFPLNELHLEIYYFYVPKAFSANYIQQYNNFQMEFVMFQALYFKNLHRLINMRLWS